nr:MAG TPA: hypothetical protein [Caudoviricetes sp.]
MYGTDGLEGYSLVKRIGPQKQSAFFIDCKDNTR